MIQDETGEEGRESVRQRTGTTARNADRGAGRDCGVFPTN
jgi:hypothetical protein